MSWQKLIIIIYFSCWDNCTRLCWVCSNEFDPPQSTNWYL